MKEYGIDRRNLEVTRERSDRSLRQNEELCSKSIAFLHRSDIKIQQKRRFFKYFHQNFANV
jgi:hypothetical protein